GTRRWRGTYRRRSCRRRGVRASHRCSGGRISARPCSFELRCSVCQHPISTVMIKERLQLIADADACHPPEIDAVGGHFLRLDELAIEYSQSALQDRSTGDLRLPFAMQKTILRRDAGKAGEGIADVLLVGGKGVQREHAVLEEELVAGILPVQADENGRRVV